MISVRWLFTVIAILCVGCGTNRINAGFPEVPPPPTARPDAPKIGIARVADSRADRSGGWFNSNVNVIVGPELNDYIERKFRVELVEHGFAPLEALNPASTANPSNCKTIVVTLQSADIGGSGVFLPSAAASADIAVQVYAPASRVVIFAQSYYGKDSERISSFKELGMNSGRIIAVATDQAIDNAFADPAFEKALK